MLLEVDNLKKHYRRHMALWNQSSSYIKALDGVNFSMRKGEKLGLVGESGCGKSTLSRLLVKLEPVTTGQIRFEGWDIDRFHRDTLKRFRQDCQLIVQDSMSAFNPTLKIKDILAEPLRNHFRLRQDEMWASIKRMMAWVRLDEELLERYPKGLSGGELQRINICRALLLRPKLLICDEIVSDLDVGVRASILDLIRRLNQDLGMAVLFISHDVRVVRQLCDRVLVMNQGVVVEEVDPHDQAYVISHPYTKKLFSALPVTHPLQRTRTDSSMREE